MTFRGERQILKKNKSVSEAQLNSCGQRLTAPKYCHHKILVSTEQNKKKSAAGYKISELTVVPPRSPAHCNLLIREERPSTNCGLHTHTHTHSSNSTSSFTRCHNGKCVGVSPLFGRQITSEVRHQQDNKSYCCPC